MEPIIESPVDGAHGATGKRSRVKAVVAALIVAGTLSTWGVASVFAASPSPSASTAPTTITGHTCPADTSGTTTN